MVSRLGGLAKDNGGYDLSRLLVGSEGTLGGRHRGARAARARSRRAPRTSPSSACPHLSAALPLLQQRGLTAAETFDDAGMTAVCEVAGLPLPTARAWPVYLLLETAELPDLPPLPDGSEPDAVVDPRMWAYRDRQAEVVASLGVPHKLDVCLPVAGLPAFVDALEPVLADVLAGVPGARSFVYGHVGDGNLHINVLGLPEDDADARRGGARARRARTTAASRPSTASASPRCAGCRSRAAPRSWPR